MNLSLEMIHRKWNLKGTELHICDSRHRFYKRFRMDASGKQRYKEDALYIHGLSVGPAASAGNHPYASVYLGSLPDTPSSDYLWIEGSAEPAAMYNELLSIADYYEDLEREMEQLLYEEHGSQKLIDLLGETAAALHIHRNTLVYRLEKIQELFALDLDDPDNTLRLLLSFRLEESVREE